MNFIKKSLSAVALASLLAPCLIQSAHANLVLNGGFESTTGGTSGQLGYGGFNATGWSVPVRRTARKPCDSANLKTVWYFSVCDGCISRVFGYAQPARVSIDFPNWEWKEHPSPSGSVGTCTV